MDAAVPGTECQRAPKSHSSAQAAPLSSQCRHRESSKVAAGLAFCEMLSQYPRSDFQCVSAGVTREGQRQFATQILRVHLLGIEKGCLQHMQAQKYRHPSWQPEVIVGIVR